MRAFFAIPLVLIAAFGLSACDGVRQAAANVGVSQSTMDACTAVLAAEVESINADMDIDAAKDRLQTSGLACLVMAVQDAARNQLRVTVAPVDADTVPVDAGELVAGNAAAEAVIE